MKKKLEKLINQCKDALIDEATSHYYNDGSWEAFYASIPAPCGAMVTMEYKSDESCDVIVEHNDINHNSELLEQYLSDELDHCIDWDEVETLCRENSMDEWQLHGFIDEADFWRWKEG